MIRSRNVLLLGFASLLNDVASEMVMPLLPLFLAVSLGGGAAVLGLIEGAAELVASLLKWASGVASDRTGRTRPFVVVGYLLAGLARPWLSIATVPAHVLAVRLVDRTGKGLRTAPRDALLGLSVPPDQRGTAFGFHKAMDHAGATLGPMVALLILVLWTEDLRTIFLVAAVPGVMAALVVPFTREVEREPAPPRSGPLPPRLWRFLVPVGLVTFGTATDAFLMLKAGVEDRAPIQALPALWVALNLVRSVVATPGGWLADRYDPRTIVAFGWTLRALVFGYMAAVSDPWLGAIGVVAFGVATLSDGAEKKLVSTWVGTEKTGGAFGVYHAVVGLTVLPGAIVFGSLWDARGHTAAFGFAAGVVAVAVGVLLVLVPTYVPGGGGAHGREEAAP